MKKIALFAAVMAISSWAQAAPIGGEVTVDACPLLAEGVRLSLSTNIVGAYTCDETPATKGIYVATCSTAGRTTPRSIVMPCNAADIDEDDAGWIPGADTCNAEGVGPTVNFRGAFVYRGSTRGGRITPSTDADQECSQETTESVAAAR